MAERQVVEYGDQLWARRGQNVEFYDEELVDWMLWHPDHHSTMPPPSLFEKPEQRLLGRLSSARAVRLAFRLFLIATCVWLPLSLLYIEALSDTLSDSDWFRTTMSALQTISYLLWRLALGALIATVGVALTMHLGRRRVFAGGADAS